MRQYCPSIKTIEDVEENLNVPTIYKIIEIAGGIKINPDKIAAKFSGLRLFKIPLRIVSIIIKSISE